MDNNLSNIEFVRLQANSFGERSKIYEKLDYKPAPPDYKGKLPWTVQQQIAATSDIQYATGRENYQRLVPSFFDINSTLMTSGRNLAPSGFLHNTMRSL